MWCRLRRRRPAGPFVERETVVDHRPRRSPARARVRPAVLEDRCVDRLGTAVPDGTQASTSATPWFTPRCRLGPRARGPSCLKSSAGCLGTLILTPLTSARDQRGTNRTQKGPASVVARLRAMSSADRPGLDGLQLDAVGHVDGGVAPEGDDRSRGFADDFDADLGSTRGCRGSTVRRPKAPLDPNRS